MISIKLENDLELVVSSEYDSGTLVSFKAGVYDQALNSYTTQTLDKYLTKDEIKIVEMGLVSFINKTFGHKLK
jgi:hypothetical protein